MNSDPDLLTHIELVTRQRLMEVIPHVSAYCYKADGVPLPDDMAYAECSPACDNYRALAAGQVYSAGFRLPPTIKQMTHPLPPGTVDMLLSAHDQTGSGETTEPPDPVAVFV